MILVYLIVSTVLVLTAERLSDLFGRKRAYVLGFALSTLASLGAGFSGLTPGLPSSDVDSFIANMHHAVWLLAGCSLLGAVVSLLRPTHEGLLELRKSAERAA